MKTAKTVTIKLPMNTSRHISSETDAYRGTFRTAPEQAMEKCWTAWIADWSAMAPHAKQDTILNIHAPLPPWNYLLRVPKLYRYFRDGIPAPVAGMTRGTHFPPLEAEACRSLGESFEAATEGIRKIHYVLSRDLTLNLCKTVRKLSEARIIDEPEERSLLGEVERVLDLLRTDCGGLTSGAPVEFGCFDSFLPPIVFSGARGFFRHDPCHAYVLWFHGTRSWNYKFYRSLIGDSFPIAPSSAENRRTFFEHQYQILKRHTNVNLRG